MTLLEKALRDVAAAAPPPQDRDVWSEHRRRRRVGAVGGAAVATLIVLGGWIVLVDPESLRTPVASPDTPALPEQVWMPYQWQAGVGDSPPGSAVALLSGGGALRGLEYEGKVAVVGATGSYRVLRHPSEVEAGADVLVSPDGRSVVQQVDGDGPADGWSLEVVDLDSGVSRLIPVGRPSDDPDPTQRDRAEPLAWMPDGRGVVTMVTRQGDRPAAGEFGSSQARVVLVNLLADTVTDVLDLGVVSRESADGSWYLPAYAAVSPDGRRVAVQWGSMLTVVGPDGPDPRIDLGQSRRLAGQGAWTPDGRALTVFELDGCTVGCGFGALADRRWRASYLDPDTLGPTTGPRLAPVRGMSVRMLGWWAGRDAAVLVRQPEGDATVTADSIDQDDTGYWVTRSVDLIALTPGGDGRVLLELPDGVLGVDVPRDVLAAGRTGPGRRPAPLPAQPWAWTSVGVLAAPPAALGLALLLLLRRRAGRRAAPLGAVMGEGQSSEAADPARP